MSFSINHFISWIEREAESGVGRFDLFSVDYVKSHALRYAKTVEMIERCSGREAIEIGGTDFFQIFLKNSTEFSEVSATIFSPNSVDKIYKKKFVADNFEADSTVYNINLETELFPMDSDKFDLILLCEVIEHFSVDPMFCLSELNRVCKMGGRIIISTPNSCSSRIAYKACLGYRPHFYMQYERDRSPYKHNFEYDVRALRLVIEAAGFEVEAIETHDVFEPTWKEAVDFLKSNNMPLENRGDDIFLIAKKVSSVRDRWPQEIYV